jgi:hypothetical protein
MALTTSTTITKEDKNDILKDKEKLNYDNKDETFDPVANFLIALKAPETKRQYPKRLEVFLTF